MKLCLLRLHRHIHCRHIRVVAAVILHRDVKKKNRPLLLLLLVDFLKVPEIRGITDISPDPFRIGQIVLRRNKIIEAKKRIHLISLISGFQIRMKGSCGISPILQEPGKRLLRAVDVLRVGNSVRVQKRNRITCQKLILGVCRSSSVNRRQHPALLDIRSLQRMDIRKSVLIGFKAIDGRQICKGFVHDNNDIHRFILVRLFLVRLRILRPCVSGIRLLILLQNTLCLFRRIPGGNRLLQVSLCKGQIAENIAVMLRSDVRVPEIDSRKVGKNDRHQRCSHGKTDNALLPILLRKRASVLFHKGKNQKSCCHINKKNIRRNVQPVLQHDILRRTNHGKIRQFKGLRAVFEVVVVDHRKEAPPDRTDEIREMLSPSSKAPIQDRIRNRVHKEIQKCRPQIVHEKHISVQQLRHAEAVHGKEQNPEPRKLTDFSFSRIIVRITRRILLRFVLWRIQKQKEKSFRCQKCRVIQSLHPRPFRGCILPEKYNSCKSLQKADGSYRLPGQLLRCCMLQRQLPRHRMLLQKRKGNALCKKAYHQKQCRILKLFGRDVLPGIHGK